MNYIKRVTGKQAGQVLHTQAIKDDNRDLMQKAADQAIAKARLTINSALSVGDGFRFVAELEDAPSRQAKRVVIQKWQALVDLLKADKDTDSKTLRHRRSKAIDAARNAGWTVELSKYGTRIVSIS